jgi:hypothetical protein
MRANRLTPVFDAVYPAMPSDSIDPSVAAREGRHATNESDFTTTARLILELALELDAIEHDRREGCMSHCELVDRCLKVWLAIKKIDRMLNSSDLRA